LLAAANSNGGQDINNLHPTLRSVVILGKSVELTPPNKVGRAQVLWARLEKEKETMSTYSFRWQILERVLVRKGLKSTADLDELSHNCEGYLGADLEQLVERALHAASSRSVMRVEVTVRTPREGERHQFELLLD
jgi:SpoVK/Ycf46/Vps4 family AAA+-type ATPase